MCRLNVITFFCGTTFIRWYSIRFTCFTVSVPSSALLMRSKDTWKHNQIRRSGFLFSNKTTSHLLRFCITALSNWLKISQLTFSRNGKLYPYKSHFPALHMYTYLLWVLIGLLNRFDMFTESFWLVYGIVLIGSPNRFDWFAESFWLVYAIVLIGLLNRSN